MHCLIFSANHEINSDLKEIKIKNIKWNVCKQCLPLLKSVYIVLLKVIYFLKIVHQVKKIQRSKDWSSNVSSTHFTYASFKLFFKYENRILHTFLYSFYEGLTPMLHIFTRFIFCQSFKPLVFKVENSLSNNQFCSLASNAFNMTATVHLPKRRQAWQCCIDIGLSLAGSK